MICKAKAYNCWCVCFVNEQLFEICHPTKQQKNHYLGREKSAIIAVQKPTPEETSCVMYNNISWSFLTKIFVDQALNRNKESFFMRRSCNFFIVMTVCNYKLMQDAARHEN